MGFNQPSGPASFLTKPFVFIALAMTMSYLYSASSSVKIIVGERTKLYSELHAAPVNTPAVRQPATGAYGDIQLVLEQYSDGRLNPVKLQDENAQQETQAVQINKPDMPQAVSDRIKKQAWENALLLPFINFGRGIAQDGRLLIIGLFTFILSAFSLINGRQRTSKTERRFS